MKKKDLYDALSGIDEKYLSDSENFTEISTDFRRAKVRKISTVSSLCGCLIMFVAVFLDSDVMENSFNKIPEFIEKSDTTQTYLSGTIKTEDKTEILNIVTKNNSEKSYDNFTLTENTTNETTVESSEKTITTDISATIYNTYVQTEFSTIETNEIPDIISSTDMPATVHDTYIQTETSTIEISETPDIIPSTDIVTTPSDNTIDGYDKTNFSGISLEEWLENSDVIWCETDTKGYLNSEYISAGNTKISEKLFELMQNNSDDTVYAVMVDFSSCIDENELLNWEYKGDTIADLKLHISEVTEYSENSYTYVSSDGTEHLEYFLTSESEAKVTEIECRINEIKSAYRDAKIKEFRYSFNDNGLEIYSDRVNGIQEENFCFYTFATKKHLTEFKCKNNEAFIFYPANFFK